MSKEVKRYDPFGYDGLSALMHEDVLGDYVSWDDFEALLAENESLRGLYKMHQQTETREMLDLRAERDALLAERDALKAEQALWAPIHYEVHRRAEKEWCLSSGCDFTVTVMHDDYAAIDAALQGEQL